MTPFTIILTASYTPAELTALKAWADALERLEREAQRNGWSRKV